MIQPTTLKRRHAASSRMTRSAGNAVSAPRTCSFDGKLTEIITHDTDIASMPMLMPLLAQLSRDDRWFAWIAPPARLPKALLTEAGIDLNKVILLHPDAEHSVLDLARRALSAGTCHAVISWPGYLSEPQLKTLEQAAQSGASHGILIRGRQHA
ncbi:cell division inhibitor SulA [Marinobacterium aestuariivivens]|uniref:Cell division inhibitor SulA n=1 Tax=Marinobacterium aestuariivivens TaxID=1698799 RepID=A0ABW2A806_9GAMM